MSESEIIRIEYEAIKKFTQGDRKKIVRVIQDMGEIMRHYITIRQPEPVTVDELCGVLETFSRARLS